MGWSRPILICAFLTQHSCVCVLSLFSCQRKIKNQFQNKYSSNTNIIQKPTKDQNQTAKVSNYMTILHILRKKNLHQHINLKKRPLSSKDLIKRSKFFYLNRQIFVSNRSFLCHIRLYLLGKSNKFDQESLNRQAFMQYRALSYHKNKGGKINPDFFPDICITYNIAREEPPTPEREEEEFVPYVTQSFYWS